MVPVTQQGVNKLIVLGYVGSDAELKFTAGGKPVANFSVAVNESFKNSNVTTSTGPNGFVVLPGMAWPKSADNTLPAGNKSISKGDCRRESTTTRKARRGRLPRWSSARCVSWAVREMDRARRRRNTGSCRRAQEVADRTTQMKFRSKNGFWRECPLWSWILLLLGGLLPFPVPARESRRA